MTRTTARPTSSSRIRSLGSGRLDRLRDAAMVGAAFGMVLVTTLFIHA